MKVTYDIASCIECPYIDKHPSNRTKFICSHCYGIDTVGIIKYISEIPNNCPVLYLNEIEKKKVEDKKKKYDVAIEALELIEQSKSVAIELNQIWSPAAHGMYRFAKRALKLIRGE